MVRTTPALLALLAAVTTANAAPLFGRADEASQCACPDLFLDWPHSRPSMNAGMDFGAPHVEQGKTEGKIAGQPKKGKGNGARNVILTIPDGFGVASETFARSYWQWKNENTTEDKGWNAQLPADQIQIGTARTRSSTSLVTDSASSASAYSCGIKTFDGGIAVDEDGYPCGTVLEAAHAQGFKTGLVATSRITHATPASFASHIYARDLENEIAEQLAGSRPEGRVVDLLMGGGIRHFVANTSTEFESDREDDKDIFQVARDNGFNVFTDRAGFDALEGGKKAELPYIGLFTESHMSYEIDRDPAEEPSFAEMVSTAIRSLKEATKDSEKGFFIMVEGSRIDHAGHANDPVGHLHDILAWNDAVQAIRDFIDEDEDGDTVMVGVADHECGGLTMGGDLNTGAYGWMPQVLDPAKKSSTFLAEKWTEYEGEGKEAEKYLREEIFAAYGIMDPNATEIETALNMKKEESDISIFLGHTISWRSLVNFATTGHSGVDVSVIGYPFEKVQSLFGNHDNTEVGAFIVDQLGLDLPAITEILNSEENAEWVKNVVGSEKVEKGWAVEEETQELRKRHIHHHH